MPRRELMHWEPGLKRWTKAYKGHRLMVVPKTLGCNPTKEESLEAANRWFVDRRAEIDKLPPADMPHEEAFTAAIKKAVDTYGPKGGLLSPDAEEQDECCEAILSDYYAQRPQAKARVANRVEAAWKAMQEALQAPSDSENSVIQQYEAWKALLLSSKKRASTKRIRLLRLDVFVGFLGRYTDASQIDERTWEKWYLHLSQHPFSELHKARLLGESRCFIHYLYERRVLENLPRNLSALSFRRHTKAIKVVALEVIRKFYQEARGQLRLHLLLGLNCGMIAQDISDLQDEQVDWELGRITRKRSKTSDKDVPVVTYQLWPETLELLRKHRSGKPNVLLTRDGKTWISDDGKKRRDGVISIFRKHSTRLGVKVTPKNARTLSATALGRHPQFKFYSQYFLGHSPKGIAERHYVKPSDDEFWEALEWLRGQVLGV